MGVFALAGAACQPQPQQQDSRIQAQVETAVAADRPTSEFGYNSRPACDGVRLMLETPEQRVFHLGRSVMPHYQKANPDVRAAVNALEKELDTPNTTDSLELAVQDLVTACVLAGYNPLPDTTSPLSAAPRSR